MVPVCCAIQQAVNCTGKASVLRLHLHLGLQFPSSSSQEAGQGIGWEKAVGGPSETARKVSACPWQVWQVYLMAVILYLAQSGIFTIKVNGLLHLKQLNSLGADAGSYGCST